MIDPLEKGKQGKVWGETQCTFIIPGVVEVWRLAIQPHTSCSQHIHKHKHNQFTVLKGHLTVKVWKNDYDLVDVTELYDGDSMSVKRGEKHQFINDSDDMVYAIEVYWSDFDASDIERYSVGGKDDKKKVDDLKVINETKEIKVDWEKIKDDIKKSDEQIRIKDSGLVSGNKIGFPGNKMCESGLTVTPNKEQEKLYCCLRCGESMEYNYPHCYNCESRILGY